MGKIPHFSDSIYKTVYLFVQAGRYWLFPSGCMKLNKIKAPTREVSS